MKKRLFSKGYSIGLNDGMLGGVLLLLCTDIHNAINDEGLLSDRSRINQSGCYWCLFQTTDSMESTSGGANASPPSDSPSQLREGCTKRDFLMMPPEEKLKHFHSQAQVHEGNKEYDACIQDLVRCVALSRLVYGERHLKLAQAHARLAKAYFHFKGWGPQAQEHSAIARELLSFCSPCREEKDKFLSCLLSIHLTKEKAESSFLEAEQIVAELHQCSGISQEEKMKAQLEIFSSLSRIYKRQKRPEEALNQCEKSLKLLEDCGQPEKTCSIYRDMAAIEQDKGHVDQAIEHLTKAHAIAVSHSSEGLEGAQISHSLALILSAVAEPHHNESAHQYFEQSLRAFKNSAGPLDPAFLAAQDDFCRFLLVNGQQERCVDIQRASLTSKRSTFGDLSGEVADTLQLIGSMEMTKGHVKQAYRTMTKCLEIQSLLYGPQHKKTKATQRALDMLARSPEMTEIHQKRSRSKEK
ncbi:uncharacterized protein V6R79_019642 [Siganus canaliculatus]